MQLAPFIRKDFKCFASSAVAIIFILFFCERALAACGPEEWDCDNYQCIDIDELCDGVVNCEDGSDEIAENCIHMPCAAYAFRCAYGGCITGNLNCSGTKDCADNSDEMPLLCQPNKDFDLQLRGNCSDETYMQCKSGECIENDNRCDGRLDCEDGSDETVELCSTTFCPDYAFSCGYGGCIKGSDKCDGKNDCHDGSDEASKLCGYARKRGVSSIITTTSTTTTTTSRAPTVPSATSGNTACTLPKDRNLIAEMNEVRLQTGAMVPSSSIVTYKCLSSFTLEGNLVSYCDNSRWSSETPRCVKYCSGQHLNTGVTTEAVCYNGPTQIKCGDSIRPKTIAHISCAYGFVQPSGIFIQKMLECVDDGQWSGYKYRCHMECGLLAQKITPFVKGGVSVNITEVPWHVGIYSIFNELEFKHICGGSIISPRIILSAAHCFWDESNEKLFDVKFYNVAAGKYYRDYYSTKEFFPIQRRNITRILIQGFKGREDNFRNDIAIVMLATHLRFSHSIRPVCIEFRERAQMQVETDMSGIFQGWGITDSQKSSDILLSVDMQTLSYSDCKQRLLNGRDSYTLPDDKFCLLNEYGSSACRGDSGGGFVWKEGQPGKEYYRLIGIMSHAPVAFGDCGRDGIVALTNVQYFKSLIEKLLQQESVENYL